MIEFDIVTVFHNEKNFQQQVELSRRLAQHATKPYLLIGVDNREQNRGFAKACNFGARIGTAPVIGFLNPDVNIAGPFMDQVLDAFHDPKVMVTGERYNKPPREVTSWGCHDWVCGACFFVRRSWWQRLKGFDERYIWSWEETDFIRRTQAEGGIVKSIALNIHHASPTADAPIDSKYKQEHFSAGARLFATRWGRRVR